MFVHRNCFFHHFGIPINLHFRFFYHPVNILPGDAKEGQHMLNTKCEREVIISAAILNSFLYWHALLYVLELSSYNLSRLISRINNSLQTMHSLIISIK